MTTTVSSRRPLALAMISAVVLPSFLAFVLAEPERRSAGLVTAPFGSATLWASQLVCALPLGLCLGGRIARVQVPALVWLAFATVLSFSAVLIAPELAAMLSGFQLGPVIRDVCRSSIALGLVAPWLAGAYRSCSVVVVNARPLTLCASVVVAVVPPAAYADQLTLTKIAEATGHLETGRLIRAHGPLELLVDLGTRRSVVGGAPADVLRRTRREVRRLRTIVASSKGARLDRAFQLVQLDRLEEAQEALSPIVEGDVDTTLLLSAIARDRGNWALAEREYRRALDQIGRFPGDAERATTAYDGLAESMQRLGHWGEAASLFAEAVAAVPERRAYFLVQLGRLESERGRPASALARFEEAIRLDPALRSRVAPLVRQVRSRSPACLLPFPTVVSHSQVRGTLP